MILVSGMLLGLLFSRTPQRPMVADGYEKQVDASLSLEKKYTTFGPSMVMVTEFDSHQGLFKHYKVWYPAELEATSSKQYPIVVFANGTGAEYQKYEPIFRHLASWGFLAIGNDDPSSGLGKSTSLTLDYILSLNKDPTSIFYGKLDEKNIGVTGHSQGGVGAIHAITDFPNGRLFTSLHTASATSNSMITSWKLKGWKYDTAAFRIPYFMVAATGKVDAGLITPLAQLREGYDKMREGVPAVMARRRNVDHSNSLTHGDGYMTAWFRYTLMNDQEAKQVFAGNFPEILKNSANWQDVKVKGLK